jgi:hypothetical protein
MRSSVARTCRVLAGAAILAVVAITHPSARERTGGACDYRNLLGRTGFSAREISDIERERPVARVLDTDRRQVAVIGAVKIRAPRDLLAARVRTIDYLKGGGNILHVGQFGRTPSAGDLARLPFEEYDLDVRACRAGDCRVRLSADDISRFHREVNWRSSAWRDESAAVWREVLGGYASAYVRAGPSTLPVYANKEEPLAVADERSLLLGESTVLAACAPDVHAYLQDPARVRLPGLDTFTYWSVEDFGIRPVIRVIHQGVYRPASAGVPLVVMSDQIYAAHYLDAAVGHAFAIDVPGEEGQAFYMVLTTRARTRSLTGLLRTLVRSTVQSRSREAIAKLLSSTKRALENQVSKSVR